MSGWTLRIHSHRMIQVSASYMERLREEAEKARTTIRTQGKVIDSLQEQLARRSREVERLKLERIGPSLVCGICLGSKGGCLECDFDPEGVIRCSLGCGRDAVIETPDGDKLCETCRLTASIY